MQVLVNPWENLTKTWLHNLHAQKQEDTYPIPGQMDKTLGAQLHFQDKCTVAIHWQMRKT